MKIIAHDQLVEIQARLRRLRIPARVVAERTGLGIQWLAKFRNDKIPDPGVLKVGRLLDFIEEMESRDVTA